MTLHSIGYQTKHHGVSASTIRRWEAAGLIEKAKRTLGGHWCFSVDDGSDQAERKVVGYARASSCDQKEELQRQVERLKEAGCEEDLSDIGIGLVCNCSTSRRGGVSFRMARGGEAAGVVTDS